MNVIAKTNRALPLAALLCGVALVVVPQGRARAVHGGGAPADCLRCHEKVAEVLEGEVPHLPVSDGECTLCHDPHAARYEHLLNQRERALCFSCHKDEAKSFLVGNVHTPILEGECGACHEVHGSENEALLARTGNELCLGCHEVKAQQAQLASVHEPFLDGECSDCHTAHNSANENQLVAPANALCKLCHGSQDEELIEAHYDIPPAGSRCTECHDAHASGSDGLLLPIAHEPFADGSCDMCHLVESDTPQLLRATGGRLCAACHSDYPRSKDTVVHAPVGEGNCGACHAPHSSRVAGLLTTDLTSTCLECHAEIEERARTSRSAHPFRAEDGSCSGCHQAHSSTEAFLLSSGPIRTCLNCHESQRHGHPLGSDRLDPRTGEPITCVTCHDPHGTDFAYQLRGDQSRGLCLECHDD